MIPGNDVTTTTSQETGQKWRWYKAMRCSICTNFTWFRPIAIKEPLEAPEQRHEWVLCKRCYNALLVEMHRSSIRSSLRLRVAMGLVAAERSPRAYTDAHEQQEFKREFAWFMWLMILFGLLHLVIFIILIAVPK